MGESLYYYWKKQWKEAAMPQFGYSHEDRTHLGLSKGTPNRTKGLARSLLARSSHARDSVVYTTDTNGLHSFRDRALEGPRPSVRPSAVARWDSGEPQPWATVVIKDKKQ